MEVAREVNFVKNKSKLRPEVFLDFLLFKSFEDKSVSLTSFVTWIESKFNISIRKQSLHSRFTSQAVDFIKRLVKDQLDHQITCSMKGLSHFKRIKIKDSTRFQIPDHLKSDYPGSGGGASGAGIHLQFEYELMSGTVSDFHLTDAKRQDTTEAKETTHQIEKGDLIIRDLGYFVQDVFKEIITSEAYFLSRVQPKIRLYNQGKGGEQIDFKALYQQMSKNSIDRMELMVTSGKIDHPIRLIVDKLPEEIVQKRLKSANKEAKKKGRSVSAEYKAYAAFNLFITNVEADRLSISEAIDLYHIRWQIELRFKSWKSYCKIHEVKKMKKERFECQLYAKLLFVLMVWEIGYQFQAICYNVRGYLISLHKFHRMLTEQVYEFREYLMKGGRDWKVYLAKVYDMSRRLLIQEKRRNRLNYSDLLLLFVEKSI